MGAGKNKSHRKKRISKHVLQAEERRNQTSTEDQLLSAAEKGAYPTTTDITDSGTTTIPVKESPGSKNDENQTKNKKATSSLSSAKSKTKDPEEAASYLSLWKYDNKNNNSAKTWKFNKNTQSWLLRHMYDSEKVAKASFAILVDYVCQGGEGTRCRVEEDAKSRARRYKEWEKKQKDDEQEGNEEGQSKTEARESDTNTQKRNNKDQAQLDEDALWKELNEHDKRKVYKRARKVMDSLKAVRENEKGE